MAGLLTIEDALARVLERVELLPPESVGLREATGRVLSEPALAAVDLPPFASSAMDGFAVRARDTPGTLPVAFRVAAGRPAQDTLPPGAAAAIATGGVVPAGADAVVPVELVSERDSQVTIASRVEIGAHVRPRGGDVHAGAPVASAGTRLGPAHLGALAAVGIAAVRCSRRPRVSVLATGSELRAPGEVLGPGEIFDSNRVMIASLLSRANADVDLLDVVADDEAAHRTALERALAADVIVTSGGVSVGPHDLVRAVARELGVTEIFWGVAVRPGKPLSFGVRGTTLVFGLPGNPVSSLVGALLFVLPAVLAVQGAEEPGPRYEIGLAGTELRQNTRRDEFLRARRLPGPRGVILEPVSGQESHMIVRAASADALVHVPRGDGAVRAGELVRYLVLA